MSVQRVTFRERNRQTDDRSSSPILEFLSEAEVGEFEVTLAVQQEVLGFEITVDKTERVKVFERQDDLSCVEQRRAGGEATGVT